MLNTIAKQFSVVAFLGLAALTFSLGYGALIGDILSSNEFVTSLRYAGIGFMFGGLALWIATRRMEAERPGLNPLFISLVVVGCLALIVGVIFAYFPFAFGFWVGGLVTTAVALLVFVLVTIVNPAFAEPVTKVWPEGGEPVASSATHEDEHAAEAHEEPVVPVVEEAVAKPASEEESTPPEEDTSAPEKLTTIEGIGPKAQSIFYENGITRFSQLASMSPEELTKTLKDGGFRAPFSAESWPQQADLAASGKWDELKTLQDSLSGGRRK